MSRPMSDLTVRPPWHDWEQEAANDGLTRWTCQACGGTVIWDGGVPPEGPCLNPGGMSHWAQMLGYPNIRALREKLGADPVAVLDEVKDYADETAWDSYREDA